MAVASPPSGTGVYPVSSTNMLARSPHLGVQELTVLLDVLADRVLMSPELLLAGEPDRIASATMAVLRRGLVPTTVVEPWITRLAETASAHPGEGDPYLATGNAEATLRALYLQLSLAPSPPADRADLLLALVSALRRSNPHRLTELAL